MSTPAAGKFKTGFNDVINKCHTKVLINEYSTMKKNHIDTILIEKSEIHQDIAGKFKTKRLNKCRTETHFIPNPNTDTTTVNVIDCGM